MIPAHQANPRGSYEPIKSSSRSRGPGRSAPSRCQSRARSRLGFPGRNAGHHPDQPDGSVRHLRAQLDQQPAAPGPERLGGPGRKRPAVRLFPHRRILALRSGQRPAEPGLLHHPPRRRRREREDLHQRPDQHPARAPGPDRGDQVPRLPASRHGQLRRRPGSALPSRSATTTPPSTTRSAMGSSPSTLPSPSASPSPRPGCSSTATPSTGCARRSASPPDRSTTRSSSCSRSATSSTPGSRSG